MVSLNRREEADRNDGSSGAKKRFLVAPSPACPFRPHWLLSHTTMVYCMWLGMTTSRDMKRRQKLPFLIVIVFLILTSMTNIFDLFLFISPFTSSQFISSSSFFFVQKEPFTVFRLGWFSAHTSSRSSQLVLLLCYCFLARE